MTLLSYIGKLFSCSQQADTLATGQREPCHLGQPRQLDSVERVQRVRSSTGRNTVLEVPLQPSSILTIATASPQIRPTQPDSNQCLHTAVIPISCTTQTRHIEPSSELKIKYPNTKIRKPKRKTRSNDEVKLPLSLANIRSPMNPVERKEILSVTTPGKKQPCDKVSPSKIAKSTPRRSARAPKPKKTFNGEILQPWKKKAARRAKTSDRTYRENPEVSEPPAPSPHLSKPRKPPTDPTYKPSAREFSRSPTLSPLRKKVKKRPKPALPDALFFPAQNDGKASPQPPKKKRKVTRAPVANKTPNKSNETSILSGLPIERSSTGISQPKMSSLTLPAIQKHKAVAKSPMLDVRDLISNQSPKSHSGNANIKGLALRKCSTAGKSWMFWTEVPRPDNGAQLEFCNFAAISDRKLEAGEVKEDAMANQKGQPMRKKREGKTRSREIELVFPASELVAVPGNLDSHLYAKIIRSRSSSPEPDLTRKNMLVTVMRRARNISLARP